MAQLNIVCADGDPETWALIEEADDLWTSLDQHDISLSWYLGVPPSDDEWLERIDNAEGLLLLWSIPDSVLRAAPNLKAIAWVGTGVSTFVNIPLASESGIIVSNTPGYGTNAVAEHTLGLMLALARKTVTLDASLRNGDWPRENVIGVELAGKTVGVVGLGGIGTRVAQLCGALGMRVLTWTRNPSPDRLATAGATYAELDDLLTASDVVTLHLPHTPETDQLLDAGRLQLLKPSAFLINTARGELVDQDALVAALRDGQLAGAAMDVFVDEPLPPDNPWRELSNVILTPHIGWNTPEANRRSVEIAFDNLIAALIGKPRNVVRG
jgi:D-3-phosphoglycerate dehydrogenase